MDFNDKNYFFTHFGSVVSCIFTILYSIFSLHFPGSCVYKKIKKKSNKTGDNNRIRFSHFHESTDERMHASSVTLKVVSFLKNCVGTKKDYLNFF